MINVPNNKVVVMLPSWTPTHQSKFAGSIIFRLFNDLIDQGLNIKMIFLKDFRGAIGGIEFTKNNKYIYDFVIPFHSYFHHIAIKFNVFFFKILINKIGIANISLVHAQSYNMAIIALYLKQKYAIPYIITERSGEFIKYTKLPRNHALIEKAFINAKCVTTVSSIMSNSIFEKFGVNSVVIPNYIEYPSNVEKFNVFTIIVVGDFHDKFKNIPFALDILERILTKDKEIHIKFIGDGYENLTFKYSVSIYKNIGNRETRNLISKSHILLSTSHYESFGLVILEAIFGYTIPICLDSGGPRDFVPSDFLFSKHQETTIEISNKCIDIKKNYKSYHDNFPFDDIIAKYSKQSVINKYIELYDKCAG